MTVADFEELLKETIGLDVGSVGASTIERAVKERLVACGLQDPCAYWNHVRASKAELQELIEAVVVPETWFFRDREPFVALSEIVHQEWRRTSPHTFLRLLSLPCSTGEEPYSMAMILLDAGLPANQFRIDAVDISTRALAQAERAVYGRNSFRGNELKFRDHHFEATEQGYRLSDAVRRQVNFQHGNLLSAGFLPRAENYDVIFCRNVLIYLDRLAQDRAITVLERLLKPEGILFVAASETALLLRQRFVPAEIPRAFAFRKHGIITGEPNRSGSSCPKRQSVPRPTPVSSVPQRSATMIPMSPAAESKPPSPGEQRPELIDEATWLADQGRFVEAAARCEEHLRQYGPSASAFHLMGLVCDAIGNEPQAREYYRKALYLDPDHHDSLIHLALLTEKQGNTGAAQVLRNRARRLDQKHKR